MISKNKRYYEELILIEINEQTSICMIDFLLIKNIEFMLKRHEYLNESEKCEILIIPGSLSTNYIEGYYDGTFLISFQGLLKYETKGYFSTDLRLLENNKVEIIEMNVWLNKNEFYHNKDKSSKIDLSLLLLNLFKLFCD